jgi:O-antigen ligase
VNITANFKEYFDIPIFLNFLIFIVLTNIFTKNPRISTNGLFVLVLCTSLLSLAFLSGFGLSYLEDRVSIFNINQNLLGFTTCISLFVLIAFILEKKIKKIFLILVPFLLYLLISTGSRVSFIALILGIIFFIFSNNIYSFKRKIFIIFFCLIVVIFSYSFLENSITAQRILQTIYTGDLGGRDFLWTIIYEIFINDILTGIGKTGYQYFTDNLISNNIQGKLISSDSFSPHNVIIEIIAYTGIIGLFIFSSFLIRIYKIGFKKFKINNEVLPLLLLIPISGLILSGQILDQKMVWLLLAYIAANSIIFYKNSFNKR